MNSLIEIGKKAKEAAAFFSSVSEKQKDEALNIICTALLENTEQIIAANNLDIQNAKANNMTTSLIDRLLINEQRIIDISNGVKQISELKSPIGEIIDEWQRPNGLTIKKERVPLGVIAIIYEARPNVTVDAAALCIKSSNCVILRGGKEAINTNIKLVKIMQDALEKASLPKNIIQIVEDTSRQSATDLMQLNGYVDLLIPRGGASLIQSAVLNATVPVIETGTGNCHIYIDKYADINMGVDIIYNAKTSRPSVCNAAETLLVHKDIANKFLPLAKKMLDVKNVEIRGCEITNNILKDVKYATEEDYETEFLDYILAVKVVQDIDEAIRHINKYNTKHSDAIITENKENADKFTREIDAAAVYVNASTRFTDGFEFGFGAEIGIATSKIHARGPMGLSELTSIKYVIYGNGQIR